MKQNHNQRAILVLLTFVCISVNLSGCNNTPTNTPTDDEENNETTLALFGGQWDGDFSVSSSQQGLHAYAEISPNSTEGTMFILVLLANIPKEQGWLFDGICPADSNSVTCTFVDDPLSFGGFFPSGVTETNEGALRYTAGSQEDIFLTPDGVTRDGRSKVHYIFEGSLNVGTNLSIEIEAFSKSGQSIKGTLHGKLISILPSILTTDSLQTPPRP